jgi:Skp family chaperone for outer membrane proteins
MGAPRALQRRRHGAAGVLLACATALALACATLPAAAQEGAEPEPPPLAGILILNQERLFAQSRFGQRIQRELEDASARLAAENRRIEAALTDEELELTALRATTEADAFRALADAFDTRVEAIRTAQEAKARNLTAQADAAQGLFFESVAPILLDIVRGRNAAVLMDSRAVLLSADRVDVTETAIAAIDAALGEGGAEPIISIDTETVIAPDSDPDPETAP